MFVIFFRHLGAIHLQAGIAFQAGIFGLRPEFQAEISARRQKFWPGQKFRLADE